MGDDPQERHRPWPLSRRSFIGLSVAGSLALACGALALYPGQARDAAGPLLSFSPAQFATLVALVETVCAGDGLPEPGPLGVAEAVDALFATLPPENGQEIGLALGLIESALVGALLDARPRPFSRLSLDRRAEIWGAWSRSRVPLRRTVYKGLNALILATYWGQPELWTVAGYPGPPQVPA